MGALPRNNVEITDHTFCAEQPWVSRLVLVYTSTLDVCSLSALIFSLWNKEKSTYIPTSRCTLYPWGSRGYEGVASGGSGRALPSWGSSALHKLTVQMSSCG